MDLFWELHQQSQMSQAQADATSARYTAKEASNHIAALEARCDKALLVCEALWTLLRDRLSLTDAELLERVRQVDLTDGKLDGRARRIPTECAACQRSNPARLFHCMYCGAPLAGSAFAP